MVNTLVTYTVTFSEEMDAGTVSAEDFGNAGTSTVDFGTVTETSPGVFSVPVTPTSAGTLLLTVNAGAVLNDVAGNPLFTTTAIADNQATDTAVYQLTSCLNDGIYTYGARIGYVLDAYLPVVQR